MAIELPFQTPTLFTLTDQAGNVIQPNLLCVLEPVNLPPNLAEDIPYDLFDLYSDNWPPQVPLPVRGNYFINQASGSQYGVVGRCRPYIDHIETRVSLPLGVIP